MPDRAHIKRGQTRSVADLQGGHWMPVHEPWKAIIRCPECGQPGSTRKHTISNQGEVHPSYVCPAGDCTFHEHITLDGWSEPEAG